MIDIIILLALAWFVLSRYKKTLGMKIDDDQFGGQQKRNHKPREEGGNVYEMNAAEKRADEAMEEAAMEASLLSTIKDASVSQGLIDIKSADPAFNARDFVQGARMAFEMILQAFAKGDRDTLKSLLGPDVYEDFEAEISDRDKREVHEEVTLVAIKESEIVAAKMDSKVAEITVQFVSEQINVDRDSEGKIVGGDPSETVQVSDEWTFTRDVRSPNPNWTLVAT